MRRIRTQPGLLYRYPFFLYIPLLIPRRRWAGVTLHKKWTTRHSLMSVYVNRYFMSGGTILEMCAHIRKKSTENSIECIIPYTTLQERREIFGFAFSAHLRHVMRPLIDHCEFTADDMYEYVLMIRDKSTLTHRIIYDKLTRLFDTKK